METIRGVSNWKLKIKREADHVTILQARTCDVRATLPESLFDLPVTALGHHALSPTAPEQSGEEILMTCGPGEGEWDNVDLQEVTLPDTITRIGDYAFLNCRALRRLDFHDNIQFWGGGTTINCPNLAQFHITWGQEAGESLSYLADIMSRELDVTIDCPEGHFRLIFPEYVELYEENCPARIFDYNIQGAGYPYHHCFRCKKLNLSEYDSLWPGLLAMEYEPLTALRLAWYRLRYPVELGEKAEPLYREYLQAHILDAMNWLLEEGTASDLAALLSWAEPTREQLSAVTAKAREAGAAEVLAILLETMNRRFSRKKTFDL